MFLLLPLFPRRYSNVLVVVHEDISAAVILEVSNSLANCFYDDVLPLPPLTPLVQRQRPSPLAGVLSEVNKRPGLSENFIRRLLKLLCS